MDYQEWREWAIKDPGIRAEVEKGESTYYEVFFKKQEARRLFWEKVLLTLALTALTTGTFIMGLVEGYKLGMRR